MWQGNWRDEIWSNIDAPWDMIIIGGGITGAGILREATRVGLRALLVEAHDFASGASSRSSKLVHGGFRYLKNAQVRLTLTSVRERERLLREGRGLVTSLGFLMPCFCNDRLPGWLLGMGLILYDMLAMKWGHRRYDALDMQELCPQINVDGLQGGFRFFDAVTDDARLVLRIMREAVRQGGTALNYAMVTSLLFTHDGRVSGVQLCDLAPGGTGQKTSAASRPEGGRIAEVKAPLVINATGAWADELRLSIGARPRLRKLRGSHLIFPRQRLPLTRAVSFWHPQDGRPVFAFPWEGITLVGTTDVDHGPQVETDPAISPEEASYLLDAACFTFPGQELTFADVQATFSGVRSVVDTGKANPSRESREHVLWREKGLLTVTGGKLTTYRPMAQAALRAVLADLPGRPSFDPGGRVLDPLPVGALDDLPLSPNARLVLLGRYGADAPELAASAREGELEPISPAATLWAELRWAARAEGVIHLDDLLLRRVRLGLLLPEGGLPWLERIRAIVQSELGWDDSRWQQEAREYSELWQRCYSLHRFRTCEGERGEGERV